MKINKLSSFLDELLKEKEIGSFLAEKTMESVFCGGQKSSDE